MSHLSESFPASAGSLQPFVDGLDAVNRRILVLLPYNGHAVGAMVITRVLRMERTPTVLTLHLAEHRSVTNGNALHVTALQYLIEQKRLQTPDGAECFCIINDSRNTIGELAPVYARRYVNAVIAIVEE